MADAVDTQKAVAVGSLAFGAIATLTPRLFLGMYGVPDEANLRTMTRLWGTRTVALGALAFTLEGPENMRKLAGANIAMNSTDVLMIAGARGVPTRARVLGSLTAAAFAGALAHVLSQ
jgi:hypothetical protein